MVGSVTGVPASWSDYLYNERSPAGEPSLRDEDAEEVLRAYPDVLLTLGDACEQGVGKLFITTRRVIWLSAEDASRGYAVPFAEIVMHAVSTDPGSFPRPCIYAQLQAGFDDEGDEDDGGGDDDVAMEMRVAPADAGCLEDMFKVFCDAAAMNPDDDAEQDEGAGEFFFNEEEVMAGADPEAREAALARYAAMLGGGSDNEACDEVDPAESARFEDADEDGGPNGH